MPAAEPALQQEVGLLYQDHHGWLQGWLRRRIGSPCDAADLAHDVFARLLSRRLPVQARQPRALLSTIAHGLLVEHWRRRDVEEAWLAFLATQPEPQAPSPESRLLMLEALIEINRMLDALKPAVREAFLLAQVEGLTGPQIALRLGVSLATVERHLAKALRRCYALRFEA